MEGPDSSTKAVIQEGAPFWTKAQLSVEGRSVHPQDNQHPRGQPRSGDSTAVSMEDPEAPPVITVKRVWFQDTGMITYSYHDGFIVEPGRHLTGTEAGDPKTPAGSNRGYAGPDA